MGLYGVAEVLVLAEAGMKRAIITSVRLRDLFPTPTEWRQSGWPIARGSVVGFVTGLIPGPATVLATFISYTVERRISKSPERFGQGAIEGVAGPETANNGATAGAMVPLLSLGIPFSPATAILLGALVIHGIQPGPLLMAQTPEVFWGVVASMYVGNFLLLILNLPLVGLFVSVLRLPQHVLSTLVLLLCLVGAYSLNNGSLDLWVLVGFGIVGYVFRKLTVDPAPLIIAVVLGPLVEKTLRQTLFMAHGDWQLLGFRPLSLALLAIGAAVLLLPPLVATLRRRNAQPAVAAGKAERLARGRWSGAPFSRAIVGVAALLARVEVVHRRRHGHRQPQGELVAHVPDVMHRPPGHPHDVVFDRLHDDPAGQLPFQASTQDHPPLVEFAVPVGAIAASGRAGDERHQLPLVSDDPPGPGGRAHLPHDVGHARMEHVGPRGVRRDGRRRPAGQPLDCDLHLCLVIHGEPHPSCA
jgi:hypothetical protein